MPFKMRDHAFRSAQQMIPIPRRSPNPERNSPPRMELATPHETRGLRHMELISRVAHLVSWYTRGYDPNTLELRK
jgi:hypothetical protein